MKIAVLGSGAMGGLYSSYLSRHNEVTVIDVNAALVEKVNAEGLEVQEPDGTSNVFHPHAVLSTEGMEPVDLIIVFVKAMFSEGALNSQDAHFLACRATLRLVCSRIHLRTHY